LDACSHPDDSILAGRLVVPAARSYSAVLVLRHHRLAYVLLGVQQDDVELGSEEAQKGDGGTERDRHRQCGDVECNVVTLRRSEVDGHKGKPDDARCVHREADKLGLVERFRNVASEYRVHCTYH